MEELKITKGETFLPDNANFKIGMEIPINTMDKCIGWVYDNKGEGLGNAKIMSESINIANQTGRTPLQLLEERNELLNNCKELLELLSFHGYNNSTEIYNAKQAIEKVKATK